MRRGGFRYRFIGSHPARVAELADAVDSKSSDESLVGSIPTPGTIPDNLGASALAQVIDCDGHNNNGAHDDFLGVLGPSHFHASVAQDGDNQGADHGA